MNKLTIIGNLTHDPELRTVNSYDGTQVSVCNFSVAVNRRQRGQNAAGGNQTQETTDFFRCAAWRRQGEIIAQYMRKGSKICVTGPVSVRTYVANDGTTRANLEVTVEDFEFVSSRNDGTAAPSAAPVNTGAAPVAPTAQNNGFSAVETDDLPF